MPDLYLSDTIRIRDFGDGTCGVEHLVLGEWIREGVIAAREGVYTTWAFQAVYDTGVTVSSDDGLYIDDNGTVGWYDSDVRALYTISPAGVLLNTLSERFSRPSGLMRAKTIFDRYRVVVKYTDTFTDRLVVIEGNEELWDRDVDADSGIYTWDTSPLDEDLLAISPSGEWIAAIVKDAGYGGYILIYKGSP